MTFIMVYVTYSSKESAKKINSLLLKNRLIACANTFPITSNYEWKGEIKEEQEFVSILKTKKEKFNEIKKEIKKIHEYDVPCIVKIDVSANSEFEDWINSF